MNNKHLFDEKQRFSLRKLTVGLASVLVGLTLFGTAQTANSQTVHAATTTQNEDGNAATITQDENGDDVIGEEPALDPSTGKPKHETVNVGYDAQDQDQTIHYQTPDGKPATDKDGHAIPDGHVTGKTDDMNKDVPMPNGYVPKTPGTDDKTNLTNPDPDTGKVPDKTVTVEHGQHTTAAGETHNVGDQITPNLSDPKDAKVPGNTYQQAITDQDVKKDLTRTVTINKPKADGNTTIKDGKQQIDLDPKTKSSTVSYHRTTTVDDVTGKVTGHGAWQLVDPSKSQFAGVDIPVVDGYTAHITDGEGHVLSNIAPENAPTTNDAIEHYQSPKIVINYTANNQSVKYIFTDGAKGEVADGTVSGVTGQTVDSEKALASVIKTLTDKGYDMSKITINPHKFTAHNANITIDLADNHGIITGVDPNPGGQNPDVPGDETKIPEGLKDTDGHNVTLEDTRKEITRSITANEPTGDNENARSAKNLSQHGVVTRTFDYDPVTKTITHWNEWRPVSWDAVTVPEYPGYTATITDGEGHTLTAIDQVTTSDPSYKDPKIVITYKANSQSRNYVFEDGGKIVDQQAVKGVTDQTVDPNTQLSGIKSDLESKGYDWSKINLGGNYKFKASGNTDNTIDLSQAHGSKEVKPGDTIPEGLKDKDGHTVTLKDTHKDVTRTITAIEPTGIDENARKDVDLSQHGVVTRTFDYDQVTKTITKWNAWSSVSWDAVTVPSYAGYTSAIRDAAGHTLDSIGAVTVSDPNNYKDPQIKITYTANSQSRNYVFKDGGKTVDQKAVKGVTDQTVDPSTQLSDIKSDLESKGYDWSKINLGGSYKFKASGNTDNVIDLSQAHGSKEVKPGDKIPEGLKDKDGHTVTLEDTRKDVTRTITAIEPTGIDENARKDVDLSQHGVVTRTFDYDQVTKTITKWNAWSSVSWDAVTVPSYAGYTSAIRDAAGHTLDSIGAVTVSDPNNYKDPQIKITYTANSQSRNYVFKDGGKTVDQKAVKGVTDQTVDPSTQLSDIKSDLESKGYDWSKINLGGSYKFKASGNTDNVIDLSQAHGSKEVKPGDKIPEGLKDKDGHTVTLEDTRKDVTRTITAIEPTGIDENARKDVDLSQHGVVTRTFDYDQVTKTITKWNAWSSVSWDAVTVPSYAGYTSAIRDAAGHTLDSIGAVTVSDPNNYKDPQIKITYTANSQSRNYVFKDGGKTVDQKAVKGVTDQTVDPSTQLSDIKSDLESKGYDWSKINLGGSYKFKASGNTDNVIDLSQAHGSKEVKPGDKIPEGLKDKDGHTVTLEDTRKDVTRTITAIEPTGIDENARKDVDLSQHGVVTRTFDYDQVTKTITKWNAWSSVSWDAVTVPSYAGYTSAIRDAAGHTLDSIGAVTVSDPNNYKDPQIKITYTANSQSRNYVFKDGGKTVDQKAVKGVTDQTVDPSTQLSDIKSDLESKGYDWSKINLGGSYKFKASGNTDNVIDLSQAHGSKEVKPGDKIPEGLKDKDGHTVTLEDTRKDVTRTITAIEPTGIDENARKDVDLSQHGVVTRTFDYDQVTKTITKWNAWSSVSWDAVTVPSYAGYTSAIRDAAGHTLDSIGAVTVSDPNNYKDPQIKITYTAEDSTQTIHYVDENGHELSTTDNKDQNGDVIKNSTVTVKTDDVGNVQVPKGWKLVNDHDKTTKVAYGSDGTIPVKDVKITHATIEVTPDKPHKKGDPIDPKVPAGSKYGAGLTSDDLNDVAYREIHFKLPASTNAEDYAKRLKANGLSSAKVEGTNSVVVRQEAAYKRTAIVDAITGEVKGYTPAGVMNQGWVPSADKLVDATIKNGSVVFNKVLIPQITGYKVHTDSTKVTIAKLADGSHAALSQLFVSFMAIPAPKDGNSTGAVNKEKVKPDDTESGDIKSGTTPVKDLTKDDQKKIADDIKPAANPDAGKGNQDHKTDETKPQANPDAGKGNQDHKTGETKPQANPDAGKGNQDHKTGETKPQANPDAGKGNQDHKKGNKTGETKPQANPDAGKGTKPGKKAHVSPIVGHDSGANKKNSKITNTAASASDKSNRNTPVGSANDEANKTNRTVQAAVVNSDKKVLPQTGASQNKIGIIGMVFASLAGMLGLAGTKKKRKND